MERRPIWASPLMYPPQVCVVPSSELPFYAGLSTGEALGQEGRCSGQGLSRETRSQRIREGPRTPTEPRRATSPPSLLSESLHLALATNGESPAQKDPEDHILFWKGL